MKNTTLVFALTLGLSLTACSDDNEGSTDATTIEIAGTWTSPFPNEDGDTDEVITSSSWTSPFGSFEVVEFNNDENWAIGQNPSDAMFNPDLYSRIVWTDPSADAFYYCTVDFGLESVEAAKASSMTADASDPATMGCGQAAWTQLTAKP